MTIAEAIAKTDGLMPNTYKRDLKVSWLSGLDMMIKQTIIDRHERKADDPDLSYFEGYDEYTPLDTELIAKAPFDDMYLHWLESKMNYFNGEYERYNNAAEAYNTIYSAYAREYNRTHMPIGHNYKL